MLLVLISSACSSDWNAPVLKVPTPRDVTTSSDAVLCGGASHAEGSGYHAEMCTGPVDTTVGVGTGSGYVWVAGPSEIAYR